MSGANKTSTTNNSGTMMGLFGHGNINQDDGWSWASEVKSYRDSPRVRQQELKRHSNMLKTEVLRKPELFPHLRSTYERGMEAFERVKIGTPAMGHYSRLEAIQSSRDMPQNPILEPGDGDYYTEDAPPARKQYDPVLQRFPDEVKEGKDIMEEMDDYDRQMEKMRLNIEHQEINNQMQPHPPEEHSRQSKAYFESREWHERTKEWMPGRPKGGRRFREARRDPILKDALPDDMVEENMRIRDEYQEKAAEQFNKVFQVYPHPRAQVRADRNDIEAREEKVRFALHKRMVREGGYDPVTLRDRRTGESVGPLPEKITKSKVKNAASMQAELSRTGANVAYALGSDRYGDPEGNNKKEKKLNIAQVDHVQALMENEGRIDAGHHDLEERTIEKDKMSNVQKLMDNRYSHWFDKSAEIATTAKNTQIDSHINKAMDHAGTQYHNGPFKDLEPHLNTKDLLHSDLMTTWAPRVDQTHVIEPWEDQINYGDQRTVAYHTKDGMGIAGSTGAGQFQINQPRIPEKPIRLWPETKKEISSVAERIAMSEKGL